MGSANSITVISNNNDVLQDCSVYAKRKTIEICEKCIQLTRQGIDYSVDSSCIYKQLERQQRARNLLFHIDNDKKVTQPIKPKSDSWWVKKDWILYGTQQYDDLSRDEKIFYMDNLVPRHKVFINKNNENANIQVFDTQTKVEEFTGLTKDDGTYDGIKTDKIEVPREYADFIELYTQNDKASLSTFANMMKAFSTTIAFSKKQQTGSAKDIRYEDVEFFDLSGDGKLNLGDIKAMDLALQVQDDENFQNLMNKFKRGELSEADFTVTSLQKNLKNSETTQKDIYNMFDFNDDGTVNAKDFELLQKTNFMINFDNYSDKYDIDKDGKVDKGDKELLQKYFKAIIAIVDNNNKAVHSIEEIFGRKEKLVRTQKLLRNGDK